MSTLNRAIEIATSTHKDQKDKSGMPYIGHVMRVMEAGVTVDEKITGVLHDLIEDTEWTFEQLLQEGFSPSVVDAIRYVTKLDDKEPYDKFINRVKNNSLAVRIKINDLTDNMDIRRLSTITDKDVARLKKYHKAYCELMKLEIPSELILYIENNILPLYDTFDVAHNREHANIVITESLKLAGYYDVNKAMVYTIAVYHDLGLKHGRENHHIESGRLILLDEMLRKWFSQEQIQTMKEAVEDHRASLNSKPRSIYGCIVAEADRDIDPLRILRRTIQFGLKHYPEMPMERHYKRLCDHMSEKYVEGGYLELWLPESSNREKLDELRAIIADEKQLYTHFATIYKEEVI